MVYTTMTGNIFTKGAAVAQKRRRRKLKDFGDGSRRRKLILSLISILGGVTLWYALSRVPSIKTFLAGPREVFDALIAESNADGRYFKDIGISLQRILVGFGLAFICAVPMGFLMGWYPVVRSLTEPWIQFIRTIPPIALIPLVVLALGLGEAAKHTIIFLVAFTVMVVTIYQGVREVDKILIKAAYTFGAEDRHLLVDIIIPSAFPYILVAARLGISASFTTLIAAEMTGTIFGLGARIQGAQQFMNTRVVLLGIITIGVIGYTLDRLLLVAEKTLAKWK
jgi:NitT/TauT family transport system permease protein